MINPGTATNECYINVADIILNSESSYIDYLNKYQNMSWVYKYTADRFWHVVYQLTTTEQVLHAISLSKNRNAFWIYLTNGVEPNPYNHLPQSTLWNELINNLNYSVNCSTKNTVNSNKIFETNRIY